MLPKRIAGGRWSLIGCALLIAVACGTDANQATNDSPEHIPGVGGTDSQRAAQGGTGGAATGRQGGTSATAQGGIGRAPAEVNEDGGASSDSNDADSPNGEKLGGGGGGYEPEVLELPPGWTPETLALGTPSNIAWFSATSGVTVTGGGVSQWSDRRGVGPSPLAQTHDPWRPELDSDGWNGTTQPTVRFNGAKLLTMNPWSGAPLGNNAGFTVLAVMRAEANQASDVTGVAGWWGEYGDDVYIGLRQTTGPDPTTGLPVSLTLLDYWKLDNATMTQMFAGNQDLGTGRHVVAWRYSPTTRLVSLTVDGVHAVSTPQPPSATSARSRSSSER